jgi:DNA polymerase III subunit epsilon
MLALNNIRESLPNRHTSIELSNFNFFDIETNGLRPDRGARITEIAILNRNNFQFIWNSNIDAENKSIHEHLKIVYSHLRTGVVVGHNLPFDFWFLSYESDRLNTDGPDLLFIDTLSLSKKILPNRDNYHLSGLLKFFDIKVNGKLHTATTDTEATRALFWKLIEKGGISTCLPAAPLLLIKE